MIRAIVFDMDGVLIDARDWHYEALNRALRLFGLEISRYDHLTTFDGLPTRRKLELLSLQYHVPAALHDFINEMKQKYTLEIVEARCRPRYNHQFALARLQAAGYRMAVASNSVRRSIETMLERADLSRYFEFFLSNEDVTRSKPDPEMYDRAIARLGVSPPETLVVEDNQHGIRAAMASGAHVLAVQDVSDVTWRRIIRRIAECDAERQP
jgi:HAD superfamily hydrolase (TIGR01509 family)